MKYKIRPNREGKLPKQAVADMQAEFRNYAGKWIEVIIRPFKKTYSNQQLRYWYGAIVKGFSVKFGYDLDKSHELLKYWCGWVDIVSDPDGNEIKVIRSITKNEKGEKSTITDLMYLVDTALRKCAEHGLIIEDPDEYYMNNPQEYK